MNYDDVDPVEAYRKTYGLAEADLYDDGERSESDVVREATADYLRDRTDAFDIVPEKCAFLVIDMQVGFVRRSSPQWVPQAERMTPRLAEFARSARDLGIPVIFTSAHFLDPSPTDALAMTPAIAGGNLGENSESLAILPELWSDGDVLIGTKHTYDAFFGTDLHYRLRGLGRDTVIISGTLTNFCCEATARAAFDQGYHVVFASDLCASDNPLAHEATLQNIRRSYGRVADSATMLNGISRS